MKRALAVATGLLVLVAALATLGGGAAGAGLGATPDAFSFAPPINTTNDPGVHPGVIAGLADGQVSVPFISLDNTTISDAANAYFGGQFSTQYLDSSPESVGSQRILRDSQGRLHLIWSHGVPDGSHDATVYYAWRDPAVPGSRWQVGEIPGSHTGQIDGGPYKVLALSRDANDRIYVMWARNGVGARFAWTDDGQNWAAVQTVPGPFSTSASDFTLAATLNGTLAAAWFDRESTDIKVEMRPLGGSWTDPVDVSSRPTKGQDYAPRLAADPFGGLHLAWTGFVNAANINTDGFYREWTPSAGWLPGVVQMFSTPGKGNPAALQLAVDSAGVNHVVWDDDTGRPTGIVTAYYIRGTRDGFTAPQAIFPQFGSDASTRYPTVDIGPGPNGTTVVQVSANSDAQAPGTGAYDNYYTWTDNSLLPTPVPTPCSPGVFSDVPPGSPFYPWVTDLVGRGAVSGYGDCTFRPGSTITRGQIAKVIVLANGFPLPNPPTATFADVPPGSPFYQYVEAAYAGGLISGYECGGTGEPCDAGSRPYFRPAGVVTRGQLSKMIVLARHWSLLAPPTGTFADVPPGTAFYSVIETAYNYRIISGYSCGGPGEPCDAGSRPYFRAGGSATRGQAAKIIDLAINVGVRRPAAP
jgi:hypothetical protein